MFAALTAFAGVQSEAQIAASLQAITRSLFGAERTMLLTREGSAFPAHRISRLTGAASETFQVSRPELEERLQLGAIFATDAPADDLPGVPIPLGARTAVLVPCSSVAAANAICAFWTEERPALTHGELDRLRALATVAGLAFDRQMAELAGPDPPGRSREPGAQRAGGDPQRRHPLGRAGAVARGFPAALRGADRRDRPVADRGDAGRRDQLRAAPARGIAGADDPGRARTSRSRAWTCSIAPEHAEALGLAIHELAVNAVKFGAVRRAGRVARRPVVGRGE